MPTTPGRELIRCSMDWTQEPQVIPSTPRETEHTLPFCAMIALSRKTKQQCQKALATLCVVPLKRQRVLRESEWK